MSGFFIDPVLYSGRPSNCHGRLPAEIASYDLLESLGVPFARLDHDPTPSIEACEEVESLLGVESARISFSAIARKLISTC